jgi:hypothetical protein
MLEQDTVIPKKVDSPCHSEEQSDEESKTTKERFFGRFSPSE